MMRRGKRLSGSTGVAGRRVCIGNMQKEGYRELTEHGTALLPVQAYSFHENYDRFFVSHHWHEEIELLYFEKGDFLLERNMEQEEAGEGSLVFLNRSELHQISGRTVPSIHHAIVFDLQILKFERYDMAQASVLAPLWNGECRLPRKVGSGEDGYEELLAAYRAILDACGQRRPGWYLAVKAALLFMLAVMEEKSLFLRSGRGALAESSYQVQDIKRVLKYIEGHYREKVTLAEMAGAAGMNEQYFCRFFRKMTGKTPITYLNDYRLEHAAEELLARDAKIMEICYENGFENISYFIKKFKEHKGMTPKEYRSRK